MAAFAAHPQVDELILVAGGGNLPACQAIAAACPKPCTVVGGGATRADSVCNGLRAAKGQLVAIHDAARPFVSEQVITDALAEAEAMGAAAPAVAVKDTIKIANDGAVVQTPDRAALFAVQTPQCFCRNLYWKALEAVQGEKVRLVTDDCSLFELAGLPVHLTQGDYVNLKITTKEDLPAAAQNKGENTMRIGHGYDVHRLVEGRKLIMGGVTIPYEKGLLGHSDADVLLHAVSDALLGAAALGDIGKHFPDTDPRYEGADSLMLLREVGRLLDETGYTVGNIDATVLCQAPKLAPHIPAMRQNIANALGLALDDVSVKATTEEHLGFTGEGLGIAAHAVALIEKSNQSFIKAITLFAGGGLYHLHFAAAWPMRSYRVLLYNGHSFLPCRICMAGKLLKRYNRKQRQFSKCMAGGNCNYTKGERRQWRKRKSRRQRYFAPEENDGFCANTSRLFKAKICCIVEKMTDFQNTSRI